MSAPYITEHWFGIEFLVKILPQYVVQELGTFLGKS